MKKLIVSLIGSLFVFSSAFAGELDLSSVGISAQTISATYTSLEINVNRDDSMNPSFFFVELTPVIEPQEVSQEGLESRIRIRQSISVTVTREQVETAVGKTLGDTTENEKNTAIQQIVLQTLIASGIITP